MCFLLQCFSFSLALLLLLVYIYSQNDLTDIVFLVTYVKRLNIPSGVVGACRLDLAYEHFKVLPVFKLTTLIYYSFKHFISFVCLLA